ncbi:MAG: hypothetical protein P4L73_02140 [Caulobacteraceae bacterium]|nr:hypothetical protein [Caulobacteraceae bacterium]
MKLLELTNPKGGAVWVNPARLLYVCLADGGGASMYGENNVRVLTKLHFDQGTTLEVKEGPADVAARAAGAEVAAG